MTWTDLGNPRPRAQPIPYTQINWPETESISFLPPSGIGGENDISFMETLLNRRTHREFSPFSLEQLSMLMWLISRVQERGNSDLGFPLSRRSCPSAGAIHPIHLLAIQPNENKLYRYEPFSHSLNVVLGKVEAQSVWSSMQEVLSAPSATLLLLAAEPGMASAKYEESDSLVWRDSGVLLGYLSLVAYALGFNLCPLGITGEPWVSRLVDQPGLTGVGAAFVGSRPY